MHKIAVYATSTQIRAKKGINRHNEREIASVYKYYKQLEDMRLMGSLDPDSIKNPKKGEHCNQ